MATRIQAINQAGKMISSTRYIDLNIAEYVAAAPTRR
jgi:hypothetical protein